MSLSDPKSAATAAASATTAGGSASKPARPAAAADRGGADATGADADGADADGADADSAEELPAHVGAVQRASSEPTTLEDKARLGASQAGEEESGSGAKWERR